MVLKIGTEITKIITCVWEGGRKFTVSPERSSKSLNVPENVPQSSKGPSKLGKCIRMCIQKCMKVYEGASKGVWKCIKFI